MGQGRGKWEGRGGWEKYGENGENVCVGGGGQRTWDKRPGTSRQDVSELCYVRDWREWAENLNHNTIKNELTKTVQTNNVRMIKT